MSWLLRRLRIRILWIAALALLFGSVAPSLTNILASSSSQAWIEVCTVNGTKLVAVDADEAPGDQKKGIHAGVHCPYCHLQQDLPTMVRAAVVLVLADGSPRRAPRCPALTPPIAATVWPAHHSRAPPLVF